MKVSIEDSVCESKAGHPAKNGPAPFAHPVIDKRGYFTMCVNSVIGPTPDQAAPGSAPACDDQKLKTNAVSRSGIGAAAFIVGALVCQGLIPLDLSTKDPFYQMEDAIRITAAALQKMSLAGATWPDLPFEW